MTDHAPAGGETPRFLVRIVQRLGYAAHIADASGRPLCNCGIFLALWQLQDRPLPETVVCHQCRLMQAKLARSSDQGQAVPAAGLR